MSQRLLPPAWLGPTECRELAEIAALRLRAGVARAAVGAHLWETLLARHPAVPLDAVYRAVTAIVPDWRRAPVADAPPAVVPDEILAAAAATLLQALRQRGSVTSA